MPLLKIHHVTRYTYDAPIRESANQIILFPIHDEYQEVLKQDIQITGEPDMDIFTDYYGNRVGLFMHPVQHNELVIDSKVEVVTKHRDEPAPNGSAPLQWEMLKSLHRQLPFIDFFNQERFDALEEVTAVSYNEHSTDVPPLAAAIKLNSYVFDNFKYIKGITSVETTLDEVWKLRAGVCQDFAHILLVMLRITGIPARYVSGYICPNMNGMRGEGATHAWVEAYIPEYGWLGLDPTNNCLANDLHVRLAVGRNFSDCSPVKGTYKGTANHTLEVGVSVSYEDGRTVEEAPAILTPQPSRNGADGNTNSYRRYMEMMQQQQQQQ